MRIAAILAMLATTAALGAELQAVYLVKDVQPLDASSWQLTGDVWDYTPLQGRATDAVTGNVVFTQNELGGVDRWTVTNIVEATALRLVCAVVAAQAGAPAGTEPFPCKGVIASLSTNGVPYVPSWVANQLDEYFVAQLRNQQADRAAGTGTGTPGESPDLSVLSNGLASVTANHTDTSNRLDAATNVIAILSNQLLYLQGVAVTNFVHVPSSSNWYQIVGAQWFGCLTNQGSVSGGGITEAQGGAIATNVHLALGSALASNVGFLAWIGASTVSTGGTTVTMAANILHANSTAGLYSTNTYFFICPRNYVGRWTFFAQRTYLLTTAMTGPRSFGITIYLGPYSAANWFTEPCNIYIITMFKNVSHTAYVTNGQAVRAGTFSDYQTTNTVTTTFFGALYEGP